MLRFQKVLSEVRRPGFALNAADIAAAVARLSATDVSELVGWMDQLAIEREQLPEWDGDSSDDIWRGQVNLAGLLIGLRVPFRSAVDLSLRSARPETIAMVRLVEADIRRRANDSAAPKGGAG